MISGDAEKMENGWGRSSYHITADNKSLQIPLKELGKKSNRIDDQWRCGEDGERVGGENLTTSPLKMRIFNSFLRSLAYLGSMDEKRSFLRSMIDVKTRFKDTWNSAYCLYCGDSYSSHSLL
jgi:hypothetical protein